MIKIRTTWSTVDEHNSSQDCDPHPSPEIPPLQISNPLNQSLKPTRGPIKTRIRHHITCPQAYGQINKPNSKNTKTAKTYSSEDSLMVTHSTTNSPIRCLNTGERTGTVPFNDLWPYVEERLLFCHYNCRNY
jgi:hypothetical protein